MTESRVFNIILIISFSLSLAVFIILFFFNAPYGRHTSKKWGLNISSRLAWILMETTSPVSMLVLFFIGDVKKNLIVIIFLLLWLAHYIHRSFIYPFMVSDGRRTIPLIIVFFGLFFNLGNGYLNGRYIFTLSGGYENSWFWDPRFIIGFLVFAFGFSVNRWADEVLRKLRGPGEFGYKIPYGGFYRYISCPNYFGEIIEWLGWAIMTWSFAGLSFAVWTFVNLAPRAIAHHKWYYENFPDYPQERKALIPGIW